MEEEQRQVWRFTFGYGQNPRGYCQPIMGTYYEARDKMFDMYGEMWCMQYSEEQWQRMRDDPDRWWEMDKDLEVVEA